MYTLSKKARHSRGRKEARAADLRGRQGFHARVFDNLARKREEGKVNIFSLLSLSMGRVLENLVFLLLSTLGECFRFPPLSFLFCRLAYNGREHANIPIPSRPPTTDPVFGLLGYITVCMYVFIAPGGISKESRKEEKGAPKKSRALSKHEERGEGGEPFEKGERRKEAKKPISNMDRETTAFRSRCCGHGGRIMLRFFSAYGHSFIVLLRPLVEEGKTGSMGSR